jgi:hypothetical protein
LAPISSQTHLVTLLETRAEVAAGSDFYSEAVVRATRYGFAKKVAQIAAQPIFRKINAYINLAVE